MADSNSPCSFQPPDVPPMVIDGADRDLALSSSEYFTRQEVIARRLRRVKQLSRIYRVYYWAYMEDIRRKYREYYWMYGKSPFKEDEKEAEGNADYPEGIEENGKLGLGSGAGSDEIRRCDVTGCKAKAMAITKFCHAHILSDSKQKLYKGCIFVNKSTPTTGPLFCSKPVLRSTIPCYCPAHLQKGEKCLARDLRKAGLNVSSSSKLRPDFHVLIAEYVRQIQIKRRAARKATAVKTEINEGGKN